MCSDVMYMYMYSKWLFQPVQAHSQSRGVLRDSPQSSWHLSQNVVGTYQSLANSNMASEKPETFPFSALIATIMLYFLPLLSSRKHLVGAGR